MTTADGMIPFNRAEAQRETTEAKVMVGDLAAKLDRLHRYKAHIALGYTTWAEYIGEEFKGEIGVRRSWQLLHFHALRSEIEAQTGMEVPGLTEKGLRGMGPEQAKSIAADVNDAKAKGEDAAEAARSSIEKNKPAPKRRQPRTQGDAKATKPESSTQGASTEAGGTEPPDTRPSFDDLIGDASDEAEELRADDVENAPEYDTAVEPTTLPGRPSWSYEAWEALTLACRDEHGAVMMRDNFEGLMASVDMALYAKDPAEQRQSA